ncbi:hypothetical protein AB1Y20_001140 [Prymnesium parvum]|uniref:dCTP pyrophosphatase 1 n=1 Tax=Prymnesium parvum TaxID=97485 RepID=A0AB34K7W5_PRYPA
MASAADEGVTPSPPWSTDTDSLETLRRQLRGFAAAREWDQFHTPRNLALAMVGEVGEVCELFQWKAETRPGLPDWSERERLRLGEELSDVLMYLVRLADKCDIDLPAAVKRKLERNDEKYPADRVRGSSKKYSEYESAHTAPEE